MNLSYQTATAQITTNGSPALIDSVVLTPAAAVARLELRDGDGSGTLKVALQAAANGESVSWPGVGRSPIAFPHGIHATLSGAGAVYTVETG